MKGIILAGGAGTRLYPLTKIISKQLLPIYDKPMIYYPLSVLMLAEIREILIISTSQDLPKFQACLGNGSQFGIQLSYCVQPAPNGIAEAFILGETFIGTSDVTLILGDNIFFGHDLTRLIKESKQEIITQKGGIIFGYRVQDPERYGVVEFNATGQAVSIEEKPQKPKSPYAVAGLYMYDHNVVQIAKSLRPSARGELEITDVNNAYLKQGRLQVKKMGRGFAWLDTGTHESLLDASNFVKTLEERQGLKIACLEEIAHENKWISQKMVLKFAKTINNQYGNYLKKRVTEDD